MDPIGLPVSNQELFGQGRSVVRLVGLVAKQGDPTFEAVRTKCLDASETGQRGPDDGYGLTHQLRSQIGACPARPVISCPYAISGSVLDGDGLLGATLDGLLHDGPSVLFGLLVEDVEEVVVAHLKDCLLYTSPSPRDLSTSRMPSSA